MHEVATEDNLSDTPWNIFKFDESGIQMNNKPDTKIIEKGYESVHVLTSRDSSENITVWHAVMLQVNFCPPPLLIFKEVNKTQRVRWWDIPRVSCIHETEIVVYWHGIIYQVVHRAFPQSQCFTEGHCTFRWSQNSLLLPFTASDCCLK